VIPLVDLSVVNHQVIREAALQRISSIAGFGDLIDGSEVEAFEERWADYVGARYCVAVANGTDALELAVRGEYGCEDRISLDIPAMTFVATAEAVVRAGESIMLGDVDSVTLLASLSGDVAVGLYGQRPALGEARVLDAAQMHGHSGLGVTASWSFYPTKNLGAWGDAGAVTTDDEGLAAGIRELARHGGAGRTGVGFNSRMDTAQAAVLIEKLNYLDEWVDLRRQAARRYLDECGAAGVDVVGDDGSVWHQVVVRVPNRDRVKVLMRVRGVETGIHYPRALSEMRWLDPFRLDGGQCECPRAEAAAREILSLPIWPGIKLSTIDRVVEALVESIEEADSDRAG
jgi:dTDP-4-amino-4,6-dideoxygalactose transaminase